MLETLNEYAHGFVIIPILDSCRRGGVLQALCDGLPTPQANSGNLAVALRVLQSLGWLEDDGSLSEAGLVALEIPDVRALYAEPLEEGSDWLRLAEQRWPGLDEALHNFMDGTLLTRLLPRLQEESLPRWLKPYFRALGWYQENELTELAEYLFERGMILGTTASYRPMLASMDELLFGDPRIVFSRDDKGRELHLDRSLNVSASGFQHGRYFKDVRDSIQLIFSGPMETQPSAICDMGCGDGTFLREVYKVIQAGERDLKQHPVTLIAADFNPQALEVAKKNLTDLPHLTVEADIGKPQELMEKLKEQGIDPDTVLHIRSFLDHNRPYISPEGAPEQGEGIFVDECGQARASGEVIRSLIEHLERWSQMAGEQGLLLLEVHSLSPHTVHRYLQQTENLHFDAYHALSGQLLVSANTFLLAAAQASLFPVRAFGKRYPNTLPLTRITLSWLKPRPYRAVRLTCDHILQLRKIEEAAVGAELRLSDEELRRRLSDWPDYQLGLEMDGELVGAVFSQPVQDLEGVTYATHASYALTEGERIQLLGLWVNPEHSGLGDELLDFALQWLGSHAGIKEIVGVTRCRDFESGCLLEYAPNDPIVRFHLNHGAILQGIIEDYRPEDTANQGCGVLISYPVATIFGKQERSTGRAGDVASLISELMTDSELFESDRPLRELGLDSLNLMELKTRLEESFGVSLESSFFFRYRTAQEIDSYLNNGPKQEKRSPLLSELRSNVEEEDAVAIIGLGCRFPEARSPEKLWDLFSSGYCTTGVHDRSLGSVPPCSLLESVDEFDERFFRIAPREAALMDPQHRLLLEVSWESLENSGIDPHSLKEEQVGVFLGLFSHDYEKLHAQVGMNSHSALALASSAAPGRLSYFYGWHGPSMAVHTACSSSLVAVHLARKAILSGECEMALAGGANLILNSDLSEVFEQAGMLSPDGLCKSFDAAANGYGRGEGCGLVVLKSLSAARRDGDQVLAVIASSVTNQDGASNGLTAPSQRAQELLHQRSLQEAGVGPQELSYLEAHGTGTSLGDPIEMEAIQNVFGANRKQPLWVGSAKANLGHTEAAAGVAGLIKAVLCLQHSQIPGQLHFQNPSPHIDWARAAVRVCSQTRPLPDGLVGVSSFGFSGTNCQVLLRKGSSTKVAPTEGTHLITLSCKRSEGLEQLRSQYLQTLETGDLGVIACTSTAGRAHFPIRLAVLAETTEQARQRLQEVEPVDVSNSSSKVCLLFTGQGSQYSGMGAELYRTEPVFRDCLDRLAEVADQILDVPLLKVMFEGEGPLHLTTYTQPAIYSFEVAMARLWMSWGVEPDLVMGHSVGEFAAACVAGMFSEGEGLRLVAARGRLMGALPGGGAMAAVLASAEKVESRLTPEVQIACYNGPRHVVISGSELEVDALAECLGADGIMVRPLTVSHAFHSHLMNPMLEEFKNIVSGVDFQTGNTPMLSNLNGQKITFTDAEYWTEHARASVNFHDGVLKALEQNTELFLEVGPAPHLCGMARRISTEQDPQWIPSHGIDQPQASLLEAARQLYLRGVKLDFRRIQSGPRGGLPTYPWAPNKHWLTPRSQLVGEAINLALGTLRLFKGRYTPTDHPEGVTAASWLQAALKVTGAKELTRMAFEQELNCQTDRELQWVLEDKTVRVLSQTEQGSWTLHFQSDFRGEWKEKDSWDLTGLDVAIPALEFAGRLTRTGSKPPCSTHVQGSEVRFLAADSSEVGRLEGLVQKESIDTLENWCYQLHWEESKTAGLVPLPRVDKTPRMDLGQEPALLHTLESAAQAFLKQALKQLPDNTADRRLNYLRRKVHGKTEQLSTTGSGVEWELLNRCGPWLTEVLAGKKPAIELLAPNGDLEALARFYKKTDTFTTLNRCLGARVASLAGDNSRPLRVLEIGAGTGATTESIISHLPKSRLDYTFTDISSAFFSHCPEDFTSATLDIERPPAEQGFQASSYDLVVAANVLHATERLEKTLAHAKWLLAPGGALVLLEGEEERLWVDLTFGLTDGWWRCRDRDYPLLPGKAWVELLEKVGFEQASSYRPEGQELFPQAIVTAFCPELKWTLVRDASELSEAADEIILAPKEEDFGLVLTAIQEHSQRLWFVVTPACPGLAGLARTMALEKPDRFGGLLHLTEEALEESLCTEWLSKPVGKELAWQDGVWQAPRLRQESLQTGSWTPRARGSYLISGGTTGIGLELASRLVALGASGLVLISRRSHPENQPVLDELRRSGATVTTYEADISNFAELQHILSEVKDLAGVFHLAGVLSDTPLESATIMDYEKVWSAKVEGAKNLAELTTQKSLSNFTVFSSLSAVLGSPGQSNHAAANSALDALCRELAAQGVPALSINWGTWSDIGSAANAKTTEFMNRRGWLGMNSVEAFSIMEALLANEATGQVIVSAMDWKTWMTRFGSSEIWSDFVCLEKTTNESEAASLETQICRQVAFVLGIFEPSQVPLRTGFFDMGLDSLTSIELRNRLSPLTTHVLPTTVCFDYPTVAVLAAYLRQLNDRNSEVSIDFSPLKHVEISKRITDMPLDEVISELRSELTAL